MAPSISLLLVCCLVCFAVQAMRDDQDYLLVLDDFYLEDLSLFQRRARLASSSQGSQAVRIKSPIRSDHKNKNVNANWTEAGIDAVIATRKALQKALQKADAGVAELQDTNWTAITEEIETAGTNVSDRLRASIDAYQQLLEQPEPGSVHIDWPCAGEILVAGGVTAAATGAATSDLIPFVLDALGFSEDGVVMDSAAAQIQSKIGNVKKGSIFSLLQSIAMGGASKAPFVLVAAGVAAGASVDFVLHSICRPQEWFVVG